MAESEASIEAQLELKKRARRRLVGAAALALFAAIVLPLVMDREPRPPSQDIQVRIPSQDGGGFTSRILPKPASTPLPPATAGNETRPAPEPVAEAKPEKTKAEAPKAEAPAPTKAAPVAAAASDKPAEKATEKTADKAAEHATAKPAEKPAPKAAEARSEHKAADAKTSPAPAANAGAAAGEQWVIQLGAYKEAGNVKLLLAKLKQAGVPAFTEKFDAPQGPRTRVRAGPFASKDAAEKARAKVKTIGVDGPVGPK